MVVWVCLSIFVNKASGIVANHCHSVDQPVFDHLTRQCKSATGLANYH